jgi:hypothetical protein
LPCPTSLPGRPGPLSVILRTSQISQLHIALPTWSAWAVTYG